MNDWNSLNDGTIKEINDETKEIRDLMQFRFETMKVVAKLEIKMIKQDLVLKKMLFLKSAYSKTQTFALLLFFKKFRGWAMKYRWKVIMIDKRVSDTIKYGMEEKGLKLLHEAVKKFYSLTTGQYSDGCFLLNSKYSSSVLPIFYNAR